MKAGNHGADVLSIYKAKCFRCTDTGKVLGMGVYAYEPCPRCRPIARAEWETEQEAIKAAKGEEMSTPEKIYVPLNHGKLVGVCAYERTHKADIEYVRADIHEAQIEALKAENQSQFSAGVRAFFNALLFRTANNYHMNPEVNEKCTAENAIVERWAEDALKEVSPEDSDEWLRVCDLLENIGTLKAESSKLKEALEMISSLRGPFISEGDIAKCWDTVEEILNAQEVQ